MSENPRKIDEILARMRESMGNFPTEEQSQGDEFGVPSLYDRAPIEGERMSENRDTQFQGFAKLLFDDVEPMFNNRFIELDNGERQEAEKTKQSILECFAECAYDLACHVVAYLDEDVAWRKGEGYYIINRIVENDVPDLTEWPKESE